MRCWWVDPGCSGKVCRKGRERVCFCMRECWMLIIALPLGSLQLKTVRAMRTLAKS